ncbi:hydroxymethylbilane synthase [Rhizorhabdus sp. FW153]|uniref:hydroxymethylbilane synthase n=1 Tax=Rhizorhabdus sp. FW153 TaxID=3400216 RepID=UPI003CE8F7A8
MNAPHPSRPLRLGTRGSPLALTQARMTIAALCQAHGWSEDAVEIVTIKTSGDRIQDRPLAEVGGKALWTKELDRALQDGEIDFAVHSMKDVETIRPVEIVIAAMLPRADVRDRLIGAESLAALPASPRIGTSSPRRAAQVRRARPDAEVVLFRGNVDTRLAKLAAGEADATLLASAGLERLGRPDIGHPIPVTDMLPAPAQGAVGIETLAAREELRAILGAIDDPQTNACVSAERALLAALGADCRSPVAALAVRSGAGLHMRAEIMSGDGAICRSGEAMLLQTSDAAALAARLLHDAPPALAELFTGA